MTKPVDDFLQQQPFVTGQVLTQEAAIFINKLVAAVRDLQERVEVLEP